MGALKIFIRETIFFNDYSSPVGSSTRNLSGKNVKSFGSGGRSICIGHCGQFLLSYYKTNVSYGEPCLLYRVDQKKRHSQKMKIGHGGGFLKKKSMTNKIKKFLYTL